MDAKLDKALEAYGYKTYDHIGDALGMTEAEKQEMDFRIELSNAVRKRREKLGLSEQDAAKRLKISKRKLAKIELGNFDVPLEQILHAYSALGGRLAITELPPHAGNGAMAGKKKGKARAK
jgi:DNA-binding XRE family transcriptional regulator